MSNYDFNKRAMRLNKLSKQFLSDRYCIQDPFVKQQIEIDRIQALLDNAESDLLALKI